MIVLPVGSMIIKKNEREREDMLAGIELSNKDRPSWIYSECNEKHSTSILYKLDYKRSINNSLT